MELPENIGAIYSETYRALCDGSQILAGIGIRAIVEAVCVRNGADRGTLEQKIEQLVSDGALSKNDAKTIHRLRDLGNKVAHEVTPAEKPGLLLAMEVAEHLLRQMYLFEGARVRKHLPRKRRKPKKNPKPCKTDANRRHRALRVIENEVHHTRPAHRVSLL